MKRVFKNFRGALSDYTVGTVIAVALTALARRQARSRRALEA